MAVNDGSPSVGCPAGANIIYVIATTAPLSPRFTDVLKLRSLAAALGCTWISPYFASTCQRGIHFRRWNLREKNGRAYGQRQPKKNQATIHRNLPAKKIRSQIPFPYCLQSSHESTRVGGDRQRNCNTAARARNVRGRYIGDEGKITEKPNIATRTASQTFVRLKNNRWSVQAGNICRVRRRESRLPNYFKRIELRNCRRPLPTWILFVEVRIFQSEFGSMVL